MIVPKSTAGADERVLRKMSAANFFDNPEHIVGFGVMSAETQAEELLGLQSTVLVDGQVKVHGSKVNYTLEIPENRTVEALGYIAPGFGGIKVSSDPLRSELAQAGMATVSYSPGRKGKSRYSDILFSQDLHAETITAVGLDIGEHLFRIKREAPSSETLDPYRKILIAHSMGGLAVARHAEEEPGQTEMIVNLAAAGYGSPGLRQLARTVPRGIGGGIKHELVPYIKTDIQNDRFSDAKDKLAAILHYYGSNPFRTLGEVRACLTTDVRPAIAHLGELGVRTGYYSFQYDILIPPRDEVADSVDVYEELPNLGHLAPQLKPRYIASKIMDLVQCSPAEYQTKNLKASS